MAYIFLDESGQFTKHNNEKYFVVGSFIVGNPRRTEKQFKSWQRSKFPKRMRSQAEIKFSEVKIDNELRLRTLKNIADSDIRINYCYLLRKNIPENFIRKNKLQSGLLYTDIIGETLERYLPISDKEFRVFCDRRHLKGVKLSEFRNILKTRLLPLLPQGAVIEIEMIDSATNANIQIADWISGAIAWYLEDKKFGAECYQILKNNILGGKELFADRPGKNDNKKLNQ